MLIICIIGAVLWIVIDRQRTAPELVLQSADGSSISIGKNQKNILLINFWATSCSACIIELPHLIALHKELHPRGFDIIGVSMSYDPPILVTKMAAEMQIPYPIVFDLDKKIQHAFGMTAGVTPTTILVDNKGRILQRIQGVPDMKQLRTRIIALLSETKH